MSVSQWCHVFRLCESHQKVCNEFSLLVDWDLVPLSCSDSPVICKNWPGGGTSLKSSKWAAVRLDGLCAFASTRRRAKCYTGAPRGFTELVSRSSAPSFVLFPKALLPEVPWQLVFLSRVSLHSGPLAFDKRKTHSCLFSCPRGAQSACIHRDPWRAGVGVGVEKVRLLTAGHWARTLPRAAQVLPCPLMWV